jgi:hypothetical protein
LMVCGRRVDFLGVEWPRCSCFFFRPLLS